ncbi:MAG: beta-galactosidase domain 3-containing protein [Solirubrobacteraceae bacterium]
MALLDGDSGAAGQTVLSYAHKPAVHVPSDPSGTAITWGWNRASHQLTLHYIHDGLDEVSIGSSGSRLDLLLADAGTAGQFWVEHTAGGPLLVRGSSLVRTAAVAGRRAALAGDTSAAGPITVWAPPGVRGLSWDGRTLAVGRARGGALTGLLPWPPSSIALPSLAHGWRSAFESPERLPGFDDSSWTVADHQVTDNPIQPALTPVLYAQDYGFDHGFVWYRGHFTATGDEGAIALRPGQDNVVSVLVEKMGQDESFANSLQLDSDKTRPVRARPTLRACSARTPDGRWRLIRTVRGPPSGCPTRGPRARCRRALAGTARTSHYTYRPGCGRHWA